MAAQLAERMTVPAAYGDLERMLEAQHLDVVHIATPPQSHVGLARMCFEAGAHVFMEKPFAVDAVGAADILRAAEATARRVSVNYLYNFETPYLELLQCMRSGALGRLVHLETMYGYNLGGDYGLAVLGDPGHWVHQLPGKLFQNVLDHVVAKLVPLLDEGELHVSVSAFRRREATGIEGLDDLPDELRFQLGCGSTTVGGVVSAHIRPVCHLLRVFGARGSAELDMNARTFVQMETQTIPTALGRLLPAWRTARQYRRNAWRNVRRFGRYEFHFFQGMRVLLSEFYRAVSQGGSDPISKTTILRTAQTIDAIIGAGGLAARSEVDRAAGSRPL